MESASSNTLALRYEQQSQEAFDRNDIQLSMDLLIKAASIYKGADQVSLSRVYTNLGRMAHLKGEVDAAREFYRKALIIDEATNDEISAARKYYCLSRLAYEQEDYVSAEKILWKSIRLQQKLNNLSIASASYELLSHIAYWQGNSKEAG